MTDRWLDVFRPSAILRTLGPTVLPMPTHISHVAKLTADVGINWGAENGTLSDSEPTLGQVSFEARKQYGYVIMSRELFTDSNPSAETIFRYSLAKAMAVDETKQAFVGTAGGQNPLGLLNYATSTGINTLSLGTNGASPTFDNFIDAIYQLENQNVLPPYGFAFHPRVKQSLRKVKDSYGRYMWDVDEPKVGSPGSIEGLPFQVSTVFPINQTQGASTNATTAVIGNWADFWIMERSDFEWLVSDVAGTAFVNDQIWIRVTRRLDMGAARPKAFCLVQGILP
jgi:HK97 family phage major capsid protein